MKKVIIFIFVMMMVTGCSVSKLDSNNLDTIVNTMLSQKINLSNRTSKGYKYYLPKGVKILDDSEYNERLYSNYNTYYLYVDIISYHYKKDINYKKNIYSYYYKKLNGGYIDVINMKDEYYVKFQYNYARMEAIINKNDLNKVITDMSYILSSIKYNDVVINSFIENNMPNGSEEKYAIDKPTENEQTFLDYVNTYDNYIGDEKIEEDNDTINNATTNTEDEIN